MKTLTKALLLILVLGVGGLIVYRVARIIREKQARAAQAEIKEHAIAVTVETVTRGLIEETVTLTGEVAPRSRIDVVPKVSGQILRLFVAEGDVVKKGDTVIAEIDHEQVDMQVLQALASVEMAGAQVRQAKSNFENLDNDLKRMESLFAEGSVTQRQLDQARTAHIAAAAQKEVAEAQTKVAAAGLDQAKLLQKEHMVLAPIDGSVSRKYMETGDMAAPTRPVVSLDEAGSIKIVIHVPEQCVRLLEEKKTEALVTVGKGNPIPSVVDKVFPIVSPQSRTVEVELLFAPEKSAGNQPGAREPSESALAQASGLKPGAFVKVRLCLAGKAGALIAPWDALGRAGEEYHAFVVGKDGRVSKKAVKIGIVDGNKVEVLEGLNEGDRIVSSGTVVLRDGALVEVKKP
ncbi:MAG: efflux RND transporter periplasmic adaptor subunit [Planctomycetota bacterium]|nr:efflux RND transporter periplasmic adaptor subunit [Planctomycetota bacterium]